MKDNYFLYVGNAYPHKNVELLIKAAAVAKVRVVYVGKKDYFYQKLGVVPTAVSDEELTKLYKNAVALVFPSLMEGFGLPAIEALREGCPVIVSDIPIFHELLGDIPAYFDPHDENTLIGCLKKPPQRNKDFLEKAQRIAQKFNWRTMAKKTLSLYEACNRL